ncbi:MAG: hypothetical protein JJU29_21055 [Verrucomicrobia bacterium]|nr:hypothetical protein [Verrucomicrobiota bacterium]MCH8513850.1 hypothetical protein [Kiritimatiellia bacterium]
MSESQSPFLNCLSNYLTVASQARVRRAEISAQTRRHADYCNTYRRMHAKEQREITRRMAIQAGLDQVREEENTERLRLQCQRDVEQTRAKLQAFEALCEALTLEIRQNRLQMNSVREEFVAACGLITSSSLAPDERRAVILLLGDLIQMQRQMSLHAQTLFTRIDPKKYLPGGPR